MNPDIHGPYAPIKRFLAIFFLAWAIAFAFLGFSHSGSSMILFLVAAVGSLIAGVYCARSFAFLQKKEF